MLKFLLDEHISPKVALGLRSHNSNLVVESVVEWKGGLLAGRDDTSCLETSQAHGFVFVTYDQRTVQPLLSLWAQGGRDHGGIVYVDDKTFKSSDFGGLIRALSRLAAEAGEWDWTNVSVFLRRSQTA